MNQKMRALHRTIGAIIAVFVLMFALTGIVLNHTESLDLDKRYITWDWVLEHYGVSSVEPDSVYLLRDHVVSKFGSQIFIDDTPVVNYQGPLIGGVIIDDVMILAAENELLLFSADGEFIEKMSGGAGVPTWIQNIGLFHGDPVLQTRNGMWRSDFMLEEWEPISLQGISWSKPQPLPPTMQKMLSEYFHGRGVSVERLVLDLHNGRILGTTGVFLADVIGLLLAFLCFSGLWMWWKRLF